MLHRAYELLHRLYDVCLTSRRVGYYNDTSPDIIGIHVSDANIFTSACIHVTGIPFENDSLFHYFISDIIMK